MKTDDECTAYHEAGHAVAHITLRVPFRYVTLRSRTEGVAGLVYVGRQEHQADDDSDIVTYLAGAFAQARWQWLANGGDLRALEHECLLAETSASDWQSIPLPPPNENGEADLTPHTEAAHELVERRWTEIATVARRLLEKETLTKAEVRIACNNCDERESLAPHGLRDRAATRRAEMAAMKERFRQMQTPRS